MNYKKAVLFFFVFFLVCRVKSLGVSPPSYELNFEPNIEQDFTFTIVNDNIDTEFQIDLAGDLAKYGQLSTTKAIAGTVVGVHMKLPAELDKPGRHELIVVVQEVLSPEALKGIVVRTSLAPKVIINVPYPGKYAETEFKTGDANSGEPVNMNLKIYSRGSENINVHSRIEIYQSGKLGQNISEEPKLSPVQILLSPGRVVSGKYVQTIDLGSDTIPAGQYQEINAKLDTTNYQSGIYKAVAVVEQEEQTVRQEGGFKLGELFVDISDYSNEFERGKIDSIIIELESFWNDKINNVYVTGEILGTNINFQTPSIQTLGPFEKQRVTGNFDTAGIEADKFQAKLTVHYEGKTTEKVVSLHFVRKTDYLLIALIVALVLAAAFFIFVVVDFLVLRRKRGGK